MRRVFLAFAVLGSFFACANSEDPAPASGNAADAAVDAKKKDTGTTATGDADIVTDDSGTTKKDSSAVDADDTDADTTDADTTDASTADVDIQDTSTADTSTQDTGTDGGPCNDLVYGGSVITITNTTAAKPATTGGTIADGTYQLTGYKAYSAGSNGTGALQLQAVVRIKNNQIDALQKLNGNEVRKSGTYVTNNDAITITWGCIDGSGSTNEPGHYSIATNKFVYYLDAFPNNETEFTK